jgi:hypothetical protein
MSVRYVIKHNVHGYIKSIAVNLDFIFKFTGDMNEAMVFSEREFPHSPQTVINIVIGQKRGACEADRVRMSIIPVKLVEA